MHDHARVAVAGNDRNPQSHFFRQTWINQKIRQILPRLTSCMSLPRENSLRTPQIRTPQIGSRPLSLLAIVRDGGSKTVQMQKRPPHARDWQHTPKIGNSCAPVREIWLGGDHLKLWTTRNHSSFDQNWVPSTCHGIQSTWPSESEHELHLTSSFQLTVDGGARVLCQIETELLTTSVLEPPD